jgi:hypothetical protein
MCLSDIMFLFQVFTGTKLIDEMSKFSDRNMYGKLLKETWLCQGIRILRLRV